MARLRARNRRKRRGLPAGAAIALAAPALLPDAAQAHGLVARRDLPVPEWLVAWVAVAVLVISFLVLAASWSAPRLSPVPWRPLPGGLGRRLTLPLVEVVAGAVGVALLALVVLAGFAGSPVATDNLAPTFVLIIFWVGLAFASVLFGDVFRLLNPWRALGRAAAWASGRGRRTSPRAYPERLGCWPAVAGLLAFAWLELASDWPARPDRLAGAVVVYSAFTLVGMATYGVETWLRRGEAFSIYFGLLARLSVFEVRERRLGLRPPLAGLSAPVAVPGTVAFVATMIGSVSFDGLSQGAAWSGLASGLNSAWLTLGVTIEMAATITATIGLLTCCLLVAGLYALAVRGAALALHRRSRRDVARAFAFSMVPIAMAYVAAHYLTLLLFEGQAIGYLSSDPLGRGWNLFGTAASGIDYSLLDAVVVWYIKVALIVAGHVGALVVAHDRALQLADEPRAAVRSQYPMLAAMVTFTSLALWLLFQDAS